MVIDHQRFEQMPPRRDTGPAEDIRQGGLGKGTQCQDLFAQGDHGIGEGAIGIAPPAQRQRVDVETGPIEHLPIHVAAGQGNAEYDIPSTGEDAQDKAPEAM